MRRSAPAAGGPGAAPPCGAAEPCAGQKPRSTRAGPRHAPVPEDERFQRSRSLCESPFCINSANCDLLDKANGEFCGFWNPAWTDDETDLSQMDAIWDGSNR